MSNEKNSPRRGLRTQQSVQFADVEHFGRWCYNDPSASSPLAHVNLKRDADEVFQAASILKACWAALSIYPLPTHFQFSGS